jgi:patatin-like phospholipase/acyl hydrolase
MHHLDHKIKREGKKKLLTLDGGGIRGIMTVQIRAGLEVEGFLQ